jgi:hypothetical protein
MKDIKAKVIERYGENPNGEKAFKAFNYANDSFLKAQKMLSKKGEGSFNDWCSNYEPNLDDKDIAEIKLYMLDCVAIMKATYEEYKKECKFLRIPAVNCDALL